jgi:hypothetical protein
MAAARWSWEHNRLPVSADTLPGVSGCLAVAHRHGPVGVMGIDRDMPGPLLTLRAAFVDALADQAAVAIERISWHAGCCARPCRTERLRAALLTSISRFGAHRSDHRRVSSLRSYPDRYDAAEREELLGTLQMRPSGSTALSAICWT